MAGIAFPTLLNKFVKTLETSGATVFVLGAPNARPARLQVVAAGRTSCLLYLWTITGGGKTRAANERRIQVTNASHFLLQPGGRTIVGEWNEEAEVWCFWDARRHGRFSVGSPSFQVNAETLERAANHGIATYARPVSEGTEVVVAVHPDYLLWYVEEGSDLHNTDADGGAANDLLDADTDEEDAFIEEAASEHQQTRRLGLVNTLRRFRDAQFRPKVMRAYRHRCAICGTALKLTDAAHILPITHPQSTDDETNGLALCKLHHAAYDTGLIGVRSDYRVILNVDAAARLRELHLDGGLDQFNAALPSIIALPNEPEVYPSPAKLRLGMVVRQFPSNLLA